MHEYSINRLLERISRIEHENDDRLALKKKNFFFLFFFFTTFIISDWLCWYLGGSLIFDWLWLREVVV